MGVNAGCPFDPRQREAAASKLKAWATTREAYTVAWHCAKYLQEVYLQPPTEKPSFASGWAVFLATVSLHRIVVIGVERVNYRRLNRLRHTNDRSRASPSHA